ncbi:MAG: hypothetical protein NC340_00995 [Ruminococcus flavefaciens]|nr:hypothetical protein [Ruminococcus flavefaciens]MCM1228725.1 hypothetical protein [Ruminococcus flavefaciens]
MNKFLIGLLITGAVVAVGVIVAKIVKGKNNEIDCDDDFDDFDYPESYDDDEESIEFDVTGLDDEVVEEYVDADSDESVEETVDDAVDTEDDEA